MRLRDLGVLICVLPNCSGEIDHLGRAPTVTPPGSEEKMFAPPPAPERLALALPHAPQRETVTVASLWQSGPKSLFGDRRARVQGDILTVLIEIDDEAEISNTTNRSRNGSDEKSISNLLGLPSIAETILPSGTTLDPAVSASGSSIFSGAGAVRRQEEIALKLAATVVGVLNNGHLVIRGSQEIRINYELREVQISGIIRPEDISRENEITYEKIADARIVYGGRGQISEFQQPSVSQQVIGKITPY